MVSRYDSYFERLPFRIMSVGFLSCCKTHLDDPFPAKQRRACKRALGALKLGILVDCQLQFVAKGARAHAQKARSAEPALHIISTNSAATVHTRHSFPEATNVWMAYFNTPSH